MTHTYALVEVSKAVFDEISAKLMEAGYEHAVMVQKDNAVHLDMHGLALVTEEPSEGPMNTLTLDQVVRAI